MSSGPTVEELMRASKRRALHLEMRDQYSYRDPMLEAWRRGERWPDLDHAHPHFRPWLLLIRETTSRGVEVQRVRIVSEPLGEYTRYEYDASPLNIAAGEQIAWLPRRQTTGMALPGNDFWLFDDVLLLINHFDGDGNAMEKEIVNDPGTIALCATAFDAAWAKALPHNNYHP